jgi:hypothetical protein
MRGANVTVIPPFEANTMPNIDKLIIYIDYRFIDQLFGTRFAETPASSTR